VRPWPAGSGGGGDGAVRRRSDTGEGAADGVV
jgi:hypothetical protein